MAEEGFQDKLLRKLNAVAGERLEAERSREQNSAGIDNIYRDRREVRSIFYRMRIWRIRALFFAMGMFLGVLLHEVTGTSLLLSVGACAVCSVFVFERHMKRKQQRERHLA